VSYVTINGDVVVVRLSADNKYVFYVNEADDDVMIMM
jgi:hypothetical protein